ncbi:hypothetical protein RRG08_022640 [Elysia crispata]|uniref:Uncharacterized protein n=1 Tax=Elysia crispata TaxID=231223 RepID=A0AAE0Z213_9GAST|nr:hypothetical protein RRG08_022640 [Elysia crispata]
MQEKRRSVQSSALHGNISDATRVNLVLDPYDLTGPCSSQTEDGSIAFKVYHIPRRRMTALPLRSIISQDGG